MKMLLGDLVEVISGFAFKSELFSSDGGVPLIRIRDVLRGYSETFYTGDFDSKYLVAKGDILVGMDGEFNSAEWSGIDSLLNQRVCKIVPDETKLDRRYLLHFLPRQLKAIEDVTSFVTVKHLSVKDIRGIEINLLPLEEQKRIAAILDKADSLRRKRAQAIALADDFLRATFLEMFGDPVTNPKGWDTVKLEELIASGPTNGLYKPSSDYVDYDGDLGTPILRIDGFYNGKIAKGYKFKRVLIDDQTRAKYLLQDGSIVINRVNSKEYVGKAMLVSGLREDTVFESNMMNFSVDLGRVNPRFLVDQLADEFVRRQVAVMRKDAVNQSSINQQDVKSIEIRLPKLGQQENYAEIAEAIDNLVFKFNGISVDLEHFSGSLHECLLASQAR